MATMVLRVHLYVAVVRIENKTPITAVALPIADLASSVTDENLAVVNTIAVPETVTTNIAIPTDTKWSITIQNSDGTRNELLLSAVSSTKPTHQEIRITMPFAKTKVKAEEPERPTNRQAQETALNSRKMRVYVIIQQSLTALFSITIIVVMSLTLVKYNSTKAAHPNAWPRNTFLTPTIVLLAMASLTCLADIITVSVYACSIRVVARMMRTVTKIRAVIGFLQGMASAAGSGYFGTSKGGTDLWGWSCSDAADAMGSVNTSKTLCQNNTAAYALSIAQVILHLLTVVMAVWALMNPGGDFKDHADEAVKLLQADMDTETKYTTNLVSGSGDATLKA